MAANICFSRGALNEKNSSPWQFQSCEDVLYIVGKGMAQGFRKTMGAIWHMWQAPVIQDGVRPPFSIYTVLLINASSTAIINLNVVQ